MFEIQFYTISATALLFYDYTLTFNDEVVEFHDDNDSKVSTTSCSFVMDGRRTTSPVRKPSQILWNALTNDISVFVLFLLVSVLHYRYNINLTRRLAQVSSSILPDVDNCQ